MQEFKYNQKAQDYRATPGLNKSSIEKLLDCPLAYRLSFEQKEEPTPAMQFGTLVHTLVLEPENFRDYFHVLSGSATTKAGKAEKAKFAEEGIACISRADFDKANAMAEMVRAHPAAGWLLDLPGRSEVSMYWEMPTEDGRTRQCKGRADRIAQVGGGEVIIDLKTHSGTVSPTELERIVAKYGYHRQAAWYRHALSLAGKPTEGFVLVFCEKTAPYLTTIAVVSEDAQKQALNEIREAMEKIKICQESGNWPTYTEGVIDLDLPDWYYKEVENHE